MSSRESDSESEGAITSMVPQLGTNPKIQARGEWDERKLSYIVPPEKVPSSYRPKLYYLLRRDVVVLRKRLWEALADNDLTLPNSIEGRGRNDQIRAENALKGLPVHIETPPERPGILDRLMDQDKVADYERWKERKDLGLE